MSQKPQTRFRESRKDLIPTCLAWGTTGSTKNILLAGMSGRSGEDEVVENGLLTAWHVGEASVTKRQFQPSSQNIFDIKWHPSLPRFATASTVGQSQVSRNTQSVVRVFEPLMWKSPMIEFECPALDINDITFCPYNLHYVTASCTDGVTYVWDFRKHDQVLLKLCHGEPLHQLDMNRSREQQDIGVGMALWGNESGEFYTGASDGIVKQWDILRSQRDAPTRTIFELKEEITCGAFSGDRSHLLLGDAGGGIHILSPNIPYSEDEERDGRDTSMEFKHASWPPRDDHGPDPESGVASARELLNSGRLKRHPNYGVGQGPLYDGPFASWARPLGTHPSLLRCTDLNPAVKLVQLDGLPLECRPGLDGIARKTIEAHRKMAKIRNGQPHEHKRKIDVAFVDLCSEDDEGERCPRTSGGLKRRPAAVRRFKGSFIGFSNLDCEVIDLTGDTSEDDAMAGTPEPSASFPDLRGLLETLREDVEEDFWWPASNMIDPNFPQGNA
ncbi:WD repeat protein [Aspergillus clavatus NRRL 1]|uniref:WD repeat protein n=1 Tax=Aspergillus clavatus (strain ATCC 1007 / CBS 513.65 / DSM 816 / NCTC 3887 / NRRL 1 / QM 1276 / 107) TaxID=344612 RepID=A1C4Q6_ASPCL|nr:WD repeat protein [Aspergillus clavatus NRRL 1]EAW14674.1 WD repeat protein [Aspergillus clavatus NRRL 1]